MVKASLLPYAKGERVKQFLSGAIAALLLAAAGLFFWQGQAHDKIVLPLAPVPRLAALPTAAATPRLLTRNAALSTPPAATPKTREEKRFGRADKDDDGRITRAELLVPRQKAFAKLDKNGDGRLAFEEWAVKTVGKFDGADDDNDGALTAAEYASTAPKPRVKTACRC